MRRVRRHLGDRHGRAVGRRRPGAAPLGVRHLELLPGPRRRERARPHVPSRRQRGRRAAHDPPRLGALRAALRRRSVDRRPADSRQRRADDGHRCDAEDVSAAAAPGFERARSSPGLAAVLERPRAGAAREPVPSRHRTDAARRHGRPGRRRHGRNCAADNPRARQRARLHHGRLAGGRRPGHSGTAARAVRGRRHPLADRVRQRGEPAGRPGGVPGEGDGVAACPRGQPLAAAAAIAGRRAGPDAARRRGRCAGGLRGAERAARARAGLARPHRGPADRPGGLHVHARDLRRVGRAVLPRARDRVVQDRPERLASTPFAVDPHAGAIP